MRSDNLVSRCSKYDIVLLDTSAIIGKNYAHTLAKLGFFTDSFKQAPALRITQGVCEELQRVISLREPFPNITRPEYDKIMYNLDSLLDFAREDYRIDSDTGAQTILGEQTYSKLRETLSSTDIDIIMRAVLYRRGGKSVLAVSSDTELCKVGRVVSEHLQLPIPFENFTRKMPSSEICKRMYSVHALHYETTRT